MKKLITLFLILSVVILCKGQINNYPQLIDEKEDYYADYTYEDYKRKFHKEYALYYKRTVTKDNKSFGEIVKNEPLPWEIIKKYNPKEFFNQITNSIKIEDLENDRLNITLSYALTNELINEYKKTGGIEKKKDFSNLLNLEVLSTDIYNTTTNEKIEFKNQWIKFCCNIFPIDNPTKEKLFYYNYTKIDNKEYSGSISVKISLPTEYIVTEITKNDIGKIVDIGENQKIRLIEFIDNKVHFEILNEEKKLKQEIEFVNVSSLVKHIYMPKYLYDFFRKDPKMKYSEFEKKYQNILDIEEDNLEENMVYVYTLEGKPDKFYFYFPNEKTLLEKSITLKMN